MPPLLSPTLSKTSRKPAVPPTPRRLLQNTRHVQRHIWSRSAVPASHVTQHTTIRSPDVFNMEAGESDSTDPGTHHSLSRRSPPTLRSFFPFDHFSTSIYSVPALLFLRMFYHAAPFAALSPAAADAIPKSRAANHLDCHAAKLAVAHSGTSNSPPLFRGFKTFEVGDFAAHLQEHAGTYEQVRLRSVTWVKALASTLSHEYLQFLVQDTASGKLSRLVVDRSEAGDRVFAGWDWSSGLYPSHHHFLPLPLLTLTYEGCSPMRTPTLLEFAGILCQTSRMRSYRLLREMCWWYAESVFTATATQFPIGRVKEWPFAHMRYSFVVRSDWLRRPMLSDAARDFEKMNTDEMRF